MKARDPTLPENVVGRTVCQRANVKACCDGFCRVWPRVVSGGLGSFCAMPPLPLPSFVHCSRTLLVLLHFHSVDVPACYACAARTLLCVGCFLDRELCSAGQLNLWEEERERFSMEDSVLLEFSDMKEFHDVRTRPRHIPTGTLR